MNKSQATEAAGIVVRALATLVASPQDRSSDLAADLRRTAGELGATAYDKIQAGAIGTDLLGCFTLARRAGADVDAFASLRAQLMAEGPTQAAGALIVQAGIRFSLAQEVHLIAETNFVSRSDVDRLLARMNAAFDAAEEYASDQEDSDAYRALVALHGALVADLTDRARPLPQIVTYRVARTMPVVALANYLYGDAGRAYELRLENRVIHPAFAPRTGRALSR